MMIKRLLAALGALALSASLATTAQAAEAGFTSAFPVLFNGAPALIEGTCPVSGTGTNAVVTVDDGTGPVGSATGAVNPDGTFSVELTVNGQVGLATMTLYCLSYSLDDLGTVTTDALILSDVPPAEVTIDVTPKAVPIGDSVVVSGLCPVGATTGIVALGNKAAQEPFQALDLPSVAADGAYSVTVPIALDPTVSAAAPVVGPAMALVACFNSPLPQDVKVKLVKDLRKGQVAKDMIFGFGLAEFDIISAASTTPTPVSTPSTAAPAQPELANTGADNTLLLGAIGAGLLLLGGALLGARQLAFRRHRH